MKTLKIILALITVACIIALCIFVFSDKADKPVLSSATLENFYTIQEADPYTPAKPENKLTEFVGYLKNSDFMAIGNISRSGYDPETIRDQFLPFTEVKGFRIDKIAETQYKTTILFSLCYTVPSTSVDETRQFEAVLVRETKTGDPDINTSWLVDPVFTRK